MRANRTFKNLPLIVVGLIFIFYSHSKTIKLMDQSISDRKIKLVDVMDPFNPKVQTALH